MISIILFLLGALPWNIRIFLNEIRAFFLRLWYIYFPAVNATHICLVCQRTIRKKEQGIALITTYPGWPDDEGSGQEHFEAYGEVTCPHHWSIQSLKNSADENCVVCSRILSSLGDDPNQREALLGGIELGNEPLTYCHIAEASQIDIDLWNRGGSNCLILSAAIFEHLLPGGPKPTTFILLPTADIVTGTHWRLPSRSTGSAQSWYFAKIWYERCLKSHEKCNQKQLEQLEGQKWYPTRLIKISRETNTLRLIETEKETPETPYATLSHCWGRADFIQLTQTTMPEFLKEISCEKLPKTFQDVITVMKRLALDYIWIDSLCIIQKEPLLDDWKREAPQMAKVYSYAILNIAATGAMDSSIGLFFRRDDASRRLPEIRLDWSFKLKNSIRYTMIDYDYWKHVVGDDPLLRRAWVVQERLLAPRVLHFGSKQLFWECRQWETSEDFPVGSPLVVRRPDQDSLFKVFDDGILNFLQSNETHPNAAHAVWQRALSSYTSCGLTKSSDKLIALAGIATELSPKLSDEYVGGLWKHYMATEMLWYVDIDTTSKRQTTYRAPSFSWASVDGAVVPGVWQEKDILVEILDASAPAEPSNPFGSVKSGFVRLRGTLKQATLWLNSMHDEGQYFARNAKARLPTARRHGHVGINIGESMVSEQRWLLKLEDVYAPTNVKPAWSILSREIYKPVSSILSKELGELRNEENEVPEMAEESWLMEGADIYLDEELFRGHKDPPRQVFIVLFATQSAYCMAVRGLIIEPTRGVDGEYRRLGLFMTSHGVSMNVLSVPHRSETDIPCEQYDPDTHQHSIVII